jgi:uncharacterized membrane protein
MQTVTLYVATALIFLGLDAVMLRTVMRPLFESYIGPLMLPDPRLGAAAAFYLCYVAGLLVIVSLPNLSDPGRALWQAAILGAMAYGTYEFTSYAVMKDWHLRMVVTDVIWGTALTGFSAWAGIMVTRLIFR